MQKRTEILCSAHSCAYNKDARYNAETISVCCDNCVHPNDRHEAEYKPLHCRYIK